MRPPAEALGPEPVTVVVDVEHSRFEPSYVRVVAGTEVRFVVSNSDPINHELIVGPADVHARHRDGTEPFHAPRDGELSVGPDEQAVTSYVFDEPGHGRDGVPPPRPLRLRHARRGRGRRSTVNRGAGQVTGRPVAHRCPRPAPGAPSRRQRHHTRRRVAASAAGAARDAPGTGGVSRHSDRGALAGAAAAGPGGGAAEPPLPASPWPARRRDRVGGQWVPPRPVLHRPRRRPPRGRTRDQPTSPRSTMSSPGGRVLRSRSSPTSTTDGPSRPGSTSCAIRAVESRAEARLSAGDTDGLVVELAALADAEPLRERPRCC